jgi:hypothetical protein
VIGWVKVSIFFTALWKMCELKWKQPGAFFLSACMVLTASAYVGHCEGIELDSGVFGYTADVREKGSGRRHNV